MRDAAIADPAASTDRTVLVWHWDLTRCEIVWAGQALLSALQLPDLGALRHDGAAIVLSAASRDIAETRRAALTLQRGGGLLHGTASGRRLVLPDGRPGMAIDWTLLSTASPAQEDRLAARAFDASPAPMAVFGAGDTPLVRNKAYAALEDEGAAAVPTAWQRLETALSDGLRLVTLHARQMADGAVVESEALARIAHEFRSPLTAVLGFAEFLSATADELPPDRLRAYLADLATAAERMRVLADDLVAMGDGGAGLRIAEIALDDVLTAALRLAEPAASRAGKRLEPHTATGLIALADADALGRAVSNLLDNAIRHGGGTVSLALQDEGRDGGATITVADTGPGLSAADLECALRPYGRPDRERPEASAGGLGLPIVREIAEAHGGRLAIDTAPGQGFTARLHLPPGRVFRLKARR
jgi:signal transduction histidine kinase